MAALGEIPWVGSLLTLLLTFREEAQEAQENELRQQWTEEHVAKLQLLGATLTDMLRRLEQLGAEVGEEIDRRLQSEDYLKLVRKGFRIWDQAETEQKRTFVKKLLTNSAATRLCSDDVVRLFLDWVQRYHEVHFAVIREIYAHPGTTRRSMWAAIYGTFPRDDSAEADLFRMLVDDLSRGRVIRQHRETDAFGHFKRKDPTRRRTVARTGHLKSAFDDQEPYELTELGRQFVHYTMEEAVPRIAAKAQGEEEPGGSSEG